VERVTATAWTNKLAHTSALLKKGAYRDALPVLRRLTNEMLDTLGPSDQATYVLAVPLIQTALAEKGTGDQESAIWHWHMAQTLYPKTAEADLSMFGPPGEFLKENLLSNPRPESCIHEADGISPPAVVKAIKPRYPEGARQFRESGFLIVHLRVTADGFPHEPRLVKPLPAPLSYAALEALRSWRFKPATHDGEPVASSFCLTINYMLK
jgi:TonB family protein